MTQPHDNDPKSQQPADAAPAEHPQPNANANEGSAFVSTADTQAHASEASGASETPSASGPAEGPTRGAGGDASAPAQEEAGDGDGEGDDGDGEGDGTEAKAEGAEGTVSPDGAPRKKRRRRRKKKHPQGAEGEAGAAGAGDSGSTAEGTAPGAEGGGAPHGGDAQRQRPSRPKKERVERERPAFNVGDVVFGKVLEVTEDALFADLAGKAKAIFDLRELLITEEDVEEYERAAKREADEIAAARAASAAGAAAAAEKAAAARTEGASTEGDTAGEVTSTTGEDPSTASMAPTSDGVEIEAVSRRRIVDAAHDPGAPDVTADVVPPTEVSPGASTSSPEPEPLVGVPEPDTEEHTVAVAAEPPSGASLRGETPDADTGDADAAAAAIEGTEPEGDGDKGPQLPRVILEPGAPFVGLVHNDGGRGGLVVLTHHPKRVQKVKPIVAEASKSGALVFGLVTGTIKGGVEVDVDGLRAFAPASHVELRPGADLSHLVGKRLPFAVTQYAKRGRDVVLSRRAMLEVEAKERREQALKSLEIGAVVDGIVRTVVPFGAFVDVGGVEGLVPLSEMSHNRADQPKDVFKINETCRVKVLRVDEKGKLWLSRRAAIEDPWSKVAERYAQGTRHKGKVARLQPFGAFIELESGIDGLIHTADLSVKRIDHPEEVVKVGDEIDVVVSHVDPKAHRIALHPAPTGAAANETPQRIQIHKTVKVVVVAVESGGLAVRVLGATGRNARGFISAAATGTPRGTELRKLFPVGKELEVKIVEMDPRRGEIKLSIKALNEETERNAYQQYRAQVKREAKFGTFADLLAKRNVTPNK